MVGPLSAAGTMCERMHAVHRWCVTGEPALEPGWVCPFTFLALCLDCSLLPRLHQPALLRPFLPAGTPMGAHRNELADLHALLHTLQHQPFGGGSTTAFSAMPGCCTQLPAVCSL